MKIITVYIVYKKFPSLKSKEEKESVRINLADEFKNIQNLIQFPYISKQLHMFIKNNQKRIYEKNNKNFHHRKKKTSEKERRMEKGTKKINHEYNF